MAISFIAGAVASNTSGIASITHGLTILSGDVLILVYSDRDTIANIADNNGATPFTRVIYGDMPGSPNVNGGSYGIFHRVAGASEPSAYTFTRDTSVQWGIAIQQFRGVHADVWDVTPTTSTATWGFSTTGTTATAPSVNIVTDGACGVYLVVTDGAVSYSGYTNSYANETDNEAANGGSVAMVNKPGLSTGATGTTASTLSASNDWSCWQAALKQAVAGGLSVPVAMHHYQQSGGL